MSDSGPSSKKRHTRSRRGCLTCRKRRVKCDENLPVCSTCYRLRLTCRWPGSSHTREEEESNINPIPRIRSRSACDLCRRRKSKCIHDMSFSTVNNNTTTSSSNNSVASSSNSIHESSKPSNLPSKQEIAAILKDYFAGPHQHTYYSILHEGTFMADFYRDQLPHVLLLVVCALGVRLGRGVPASENSNPDEWVSEARSIIMHDCLNRPCCITSLATLLLIIQYDSQAGNFFSVWMLSALAFRTAQAMKLNQDQEVPALSDPSEVHLSAFQHAEIRRRLMWSCFAIDCAINGGDTKMQHMSESSVPIRLPSHEENFEHDVPSTTPYLYDLQPSITLGISGYMIRLISIRHRIQAWTIEFRDSLSTQTQLSSTTLSPYTDLPWKPNSTFSRLYGELIQWVDLLPKHLLFTTDTLENHLRQGVFVRFVTMHVMLRSCYCLLHRYLLWPPFSPPFLVKRKTEWLLSEDPPAGFIEQRRLDRLSHAVAMAEILAYAEQYRTNIELDPFVGVSCFQAVSSLAHEYIETEQNFQAGLSKERVNLAIQTLEATLSRIARFSTPTHQLYQYYLGRKQVHSHLEECESVSPSRVPSPPHNLDRINTAVLVHSAYLENSKFGRSGTPLSSNGRAVSNSNTQEASEYQNIGTLHDDKPPEESNQILNGLNNHHQNPYAIELDAVFDDPFVWEGAGSAFDGGLSHCIVTALNGGM